MVTISLDNWHSTVFFIEKKPVYWTEKICCILFRTQHLLTLPMHTCVYIYIYTHTHTHTHIHADTYTCNDISLFWYEVLPFFVTGNITSHLQCFQTCWHNCNYLYNEDNGSFRSNTVSWLCFPCYYVYPLFISQAIQFPGYVFLVTMYTPSSYQNN